MADEAAARPLTSDAFARLMAQFAPFERAPRLAVAVSGGADSLALALLANEWARAAGGTIAALTVDHRLRPESAAEAMQVGAWLGRHRIEHAILVRVGARPAGDVQAKARAARYGLLEAWCRDHGVLHLLTAHHREDQAETLLLRLGRGSGLDGLAGMPAVAERGSCRVLRPLLSEPRARLAATLTAQGQDWIEDPSNRDPAYARARLRAAAAMLAGEGLTAERLAATAGRLARARAALEAVVAGLLARCVWLHPAGFAWLDPSPLVAAPAETALRALGAVIAAVGGGAHAPELAALERLLDALPDGIGSGRTLGGCRILPRRGRILVCREPEAAAAPVQAAPGAGALWDGRFALDVAALAPAGLALGALGGGAIGGGAIGGDWAEAGARHRIPPAARPTLPALRDGAGLVAVPHLGHIRPDVAPGLWTLSFRPQRSLTLGPFRGGFRVV